MFVCVVCMGKLWWSCLRVHKRVSRCVLLEDLHLPSSCQSGESNLPPSHFYLSPCTYILLQMYIHLLFVSISDVLQCVCARALSNAWVTLLHFDQTGLESWNWPDNQSEKGKIRFCLGLSTSLGHFLQAEMKEMNCIVKKTFAMILIWWISYEIAKSDSS